MQPCGPGGVVGAWVWGVTRVRTLQWATRSLLVYSSSGCCPQPPKLQLLGGQEPLAPYPPTKLSKLGLWFAGLMRASGTRPRVGHPRPKPRGHRPSPPPGSEPRTPRPPSLAGRVLASPGPVTTEGGRRGRGVREGDGGAEAGRGARGGHGAVPQRLLQGCQRRGHQDGLQQPGGGQPAMRRRECPPRSAEGGEGAHTCPRS